MTPSPVLDASALLAALNDEPGADTVVAAVEGEEPPLMSAVNLAEVVSRLAEHGLSEEEILEVLAQVPVTVIPFDREWAMRVGLLRPRTKQLGLSLGDRACLALGASLERPVLTTDRAWARADIGVDIRLIR